MQIIFLAEQKKHVNYFNDFFVFFKWGKRLRKEGIDVKISYDLESFEKKQADIYAISNRYRFGNEDGLKNLIHRLKEKGKTVAILDANDTSGLVNFDLIRDVDFIIKKQVLKDRTQYTQNNYDLSVRPWLPNMPEKKQYPNYVPCPADQLHKIRIGWNIGMCDYRYFPHYLTPLRNYIVTDLPELDIDKIIGQKQYFTGFRGGMDYGKPEISFQRNAVATVLTRLQFDDVKIGKRVNKKQFIEELKTCKIGLSPFGWGEVCFRDFELAYYGCLVVKPSMEHMDTFPNMYLDNETYIKLRWDMTDLEEKLIEIRSNFDAYKPIVKNAYHRFMSYQNDGDLFVNHFKKLLTGEPQ